MSDAEHLTVTLTGEIAAAIREAVDVGDYASTDEVVRSALHAWTRRDRGSSAGAAGAEIHADIARGMADVAAGRVSDFDVARIVERGRALSARP